MQEKINMTPETKCIQTIFVVMTKSHYISFVAALSSDGLQLIKLYPESKAETRLKSRGVKKIYCFCNRDGLFLVDVNKHIINTNGK